MVSIRPQGRLAQIRLFAVVAVFLGLVGCAASGPREDAAPAEQEPVTALPEGELPPIERLPNPYLTQAQPVPAEAERQFAKALALVQNEDFAAAEQTLKQLTQNYPTLSGPWVNLGLLYRQQGDLEQAESALRQAITVNSLNVDAYNQLAILKREQGQFAEAEALYQQALGVWPHSADTHRNLGILYDLYMGQLDKAMEHYQMAARLAEGEPDRELQGWIIDLQRRLHREAG